jgi:serine/threonine protein kinase
MADILRFRRVTGEQEEITARVDDAEFPAGEFLTTRTVWLEDGVGGGRELRQHRPVGGDRRHDGYLRLDNEILAGRRLHQVAGYSGYPPELACLYGDEATSADPFALFGPYQGEPLAEVGEYLDPHSFDQLLTGLLTALCWLAGAGIAHRAITPDTVLWDSDNDRVQLTDFSRSAPFGAVRTPVSGSPAWVARESQPDTCYGRVGPGDDVWAAARLLYFVRSRGKNLDNRGQLADTGLAQMFNGLLEPVFGPPEGRPTARDLVEHGLRRRHLLPSLEDGGRRLIQGRASFLNARARLHPDAPVPPDFWDDITWARGPREAPPSPQPPQRGAG